MNLVLNNIQHHFGDLDFSYNAKITDKVVGIFGLSGSGKTTLMNLISGIETPESGKIEFNQITFFDKENKINKPINKRNIGIVFQENNLFPHLNIKKNLMYSFPYLNGKECNIKFETVVSLLNIEHLLSKKPSQLSGGERQRVAIGRSLLAQPELLLMDEPFSNLDKDRRKQITSYLIKINKKFNIPLIIISHDLEDILKLTRSLLIVEDRKVKVQGNYLDIADSGVASNIISHKKYVNIIELQHYKYDKNENLNSFYLNKNKTQQFLRTNSQLFAEKENQNKLCRLCVYPDDIALIGQPIQNSSVQNQLKGVIKKINMVEGSCFITIDVGIDLVAEITQSAVTHMQLNEGDTIYCLIKAKAIEVIHVYK